MAPQHRLGRVLIVLAVGMLVMGAKLIMSAPAALPEDDLVALAPAPPPHPEPQVVADAAQPTPAPVPTRVISSDTQFERVLRPLLR